jgi:hypothetical protein
MGKKNGSKTASESRAPRTKSAAAVAKKAANIKAAEERLARLQAQQTLVNKYRAKGVVGSDNVILRLVEQEEHQQAETRCREFVERAMAVHGDRITKSLALNGRPCQVAGRIRGFMKLNALTIDPPKMTRERYFYLMGNNCRIHKIRLADAENVLELSKPAERPEAEAFWEGYHKGYHNGTEPENGSLPLLDSL